MLLNTTMLAIEKAQFIRVIDGDTLLVKYNNNVEKVRLIGVDAPETSNSKQLDWQIKYWKEDRTQLLNKGHQATTFVKQICASQATIYLEFDIQKRDRFGRLLAYVFLEDNTFLNQLLIEVNMGHIFFMLPNILYQNQLKQAWLK